MNKMTKDIIPVGEPPKTRLCKCYQTVLRIPVWEDARAVALRELGSCRSWTCFWRETWMIKGNLVAHNLFLTPEAEAVFSCSRCFQWKSWKPRGKPGALGLLLWPFSFWGFTAASQINKATGGLKAQSRQMTKRKESLFCLNIICLSCVHCH